MRWLFRALPLVPLVTLIAAEPSAAPKLEPRGCPADMVRVRDFCVDRFEAAMVDDRSGQLLSPYYPPDPRVVSGIYQGWIIEHSTVGAAAARDVPLPELPLIQRTRTDYAARAVSRAGMVPQGYVSQIAARRACERAGKRLCSESEWVTACKGEGGTKFPYGEQFDANACNVYRHVHPAGALHGSASYGHRDPRLNLVDEPGVGPLLRLTGATARCVSHWHGDRIFDMVGNVDEWVDDPYGLFLGGFYARSTREGCESRVSAHPPIYYDYSTGVRCCRAAETGASGAQHASAP